jgi:hypothetical protein
LARLGFCVAAFFADLDDGGGGVFASRLTASVKLMFNLKSMAFGISQ